MDMEYNRQLLSDTQCLAFGIKDKRRCRLQKVPGEKTCKTHHTYYKNWFKTHPGFTSFKRLTKRQLNEYIFQIEGKHVEITEAYIKSLHVSYIEYYVFLLTYKPYSPSIHPQMIHAYLDIAYKPTYAYPMTTDITILKKNIGVCMNFLLQDIESCKIVFKYILDYIIRYVLLIELHESNESYIEWILETTFVENAGWRHLLYSTWPMITFKKRCIEFVKDSVSEFNKNMVELILEPVMTNTMKLFTVMHKLQLETSITSYKEELIAKAWHPNRLQKWLDMGYGFDILERL